MAKRALTILIAVPLALAMLSGVALAQEATDRQVLLLLPVPTPDQVPAGITAEAYTGEAALPLLWQLARLQNQGRIADFELLPDYHAIRVTLAGSDAVLAELAGRLAILPLDAATLACAQDAAHAVRQTVQAAEVLATTATHTTAHPQATNPSIAVYYTPSGYGEVSGNTDPNISVTLVLKRASGQVKITRTTTSDSSGRYYFYPVWQSCVGYDFGIRPGDIVEVTAAGNTVRLDVVPISAFPDPTTDTVSGTTAPSRPVEIQGPTSSITCTSAWFFGSTSSDGTGAFSAAASPGFDRSAWTYVRVYDSSGNYCYTYFYPPSIGLDEYTSDISGYLKPNVLYSAILRRSGSPVASDSGTTDKSGWYQGHFAAAVQAGDVIEISGGGISMDLTVVEMNNLVLDPAADRISGSIGTLGAGRTVEVYPCHSSDFGCTVGCQCLSTVADGSGSFTLDYAAAGYDLLRPDYDYEPSIWDDEGNVQWFRGKLVVPVVAAHVGGHEARGYWFEPDAPVTVVLRGSGGVVKDSFSDTTGDYDARFGGYFAVVSAPGDTVEVGNGSVTMTVTLPDLSARLDVVSNVVEGRAPAGSVLDVYLDGDYPGYNYYCGQATAGGGNTYTSNMGGIDVQAQDEATVFYPATDGHKAWASSHALFIDAHKEASHLDGCAPTAGTTVTLTLSRSGSPLETVTLTADLYGYYWGILTSTIQEGDSVQAAPQGSSAYTLTIPPLSVAQDVAGNRVYGQTAPNSPMEAGLGIGYYLYLLSTQSDASGNYEVLFTGGYDWDCNPIAAGECTQPRAIYYDPQGQAAWQEGPSPPDVSADAYEPDDDYTSASSYGGVQAHSFHAYTDTDWTAFTIGAPDVGQLYILQTMNLGSNVDTVMYLYDTDGTTPIDYDDDSGPGRASLIAWSPAVTGTYYVQVQPYSGSSTVVCGSTYDLMISPFNVYLPLVLRDYP